MSSTAMEQSPTKQITEKLQRLNLHTAGDGSKSTRSQSETLTSAKNHLHIPKLIFNDGFADESKVGVDTEAVDEVSSDATVDEGETVIHNKHSADTTLPDWMAVKLKMQSQSSKIDTKPRLINRNKIFSSTHLKPKLVSSVTDSESETENKLDEDNFKNDTWEEMKRQYFIDSGIESSDDDDDDEEIRKETDDTITKERDLDDTSAYSFQDPNNLRILSDAQSSSNGTKKVTSFKLNYVDSPLATPKIIKNLKQLSSTQDNENNIKNKDQVEMKLITPIDQNMKFDADLGQWIFPGHNTKKEGPYYNDVLLVEDELTNLKIHEKQENSTMKNSNSTTFEIDAQQVTNVSQLDLSFSESRKALISALTSVLKPKTNWDQVHEVEISNKKLVTVKGLEEFLPELVHVILNDNQLTTIEGLSKNLQTILISNNKISDHFLNFKKFHFLHKIDISFNKLSNLKSFQNLKNLRSLNASNNCIKEFIELPSLQELNVSNNDISGELSFTNFKFPNLQVLDFGGNKITKLMIDNLKELRNLKINDNKLELLEFKGPSPKLKKLNIMGNENLQELDIRGKLLSLRCLSIGGYTKIEGEFVNLERLKVFNDDHLQNLFNGSLKINKHLLSISLNNCSIDSKLLLSSKIFNNFPHLQKIDLSCNNIKDISYLNLVVFLQKFRNLKKIKLDNNPIIDELQLDEDKKLFKLMIKKLTNDY